MTRTDHLIKLMLRALSAGDLPRSAVTNKIKNYESSARSEAVEACIDNGFVSFYDGTPGNGRTAVMIRITSKGKAKLASMQGQFKDVSAWSK